jgi:putative membrane protein (TIGR04086 family)
MRKTLNYQKGINYIEIIKGVLFAYLLTIFLFLILGGILFFTKASENIIPSAVVIISAISILAAGICVTKKTERLGWLNGGLMGFLYVLLLFMFSAFKSQLTFGVSTIIDLALGFVIGAISGILGINL